MGADGEEEEENEEIDQLELQRRKERLEREQWIREQVCVCEKLMLCVRACVHVSDSDSVMQTEARAKKGEDGDDEEKIEEEDSQFMKLAKKLTAKTLQKRGTYMPFFFLLIVFKTSAG